MAMGWAVGKKRYSVGQVLSVLLITIGITLATLSSSTRSSAGHDKSAPTAPRISEAKQYALGIALLAGALVVSALMGLWQERTYALYGAVWEEGLFYSASRSERSPSDDFARLSLSPAAPLPQVWPLPEVAVPSAISSTSATKSPTPTEGPGRKAKTTKTTTTTAAYDIVVKRDDSANNPAEKVEPEVMLQRMRMHATQVRQRRMFERVGEE
ncbi:hypothetical protein QFC19_006634 [Naganishia cerealis]|uniref:Uncharacterized protein n=1 Tax=Naganishia cerealis TaxID=610337 RepID=A0ACC2VFS8_9TREE|nr:hypothetical protein QFC19_006634 [Naganishia cerealis]